MEGRVNEAPAIGINLGTTYSCVAVWNHDRIEIIPNEQGNRTTPSAVAFLDAKRLIGDGAKNQVAMNPANTIFVAMQECELFDGKEPCKSVNPDETVAYGAAVMAAKLSGNNDNKVPDFVLLDVTPLSLGQEIRGEVFDIVIPRNTPIPTKKYKAYRTCEDYQTSVSTKVYQGERVRCTDNHFLGKFTISGIPRARKRVIKFKDCFEIDANGILTVKSKVLSTGKTKQLTITNENGRLSKEDIEKMIKDAEIYKREDEEYKKKVDALNALEEKIINILNKIEENEIMRRVHPMSLENKIELKIA